MTKRSGGDEPPAVKLVSQNADYDIKLMRAKQRVARLLANLSAIILRTIAGSTSAAPIMQNVLELVDAQQDLLALSGELLDPNNEKLALRLKEAQFDSLEGYRAFEYTAGMEKIVRGALRLAAHQILKEREHFGGKYSSLEIERGIAMVTRSKNPPPRKRNRVVL
ncbi:hypothetical protein QCM77_30910 [Bradyrhizobium sp. SSUT18]|uniref:hypothetical protein n=1 Tax=Bradyrhizobium sp. SSUT18 TaxID=3040602 RepID=UPI002447D6CF|nr:hypothetical protein [Bradyrhizobium sp. SSUT18]MDH2404331.1 hypothetical protein [Bradyrhizobium sp. SSUT18]